MKKYLIILLIILSACSAIRKAETTISANQNNSYVKLKKFKGDTLGYVQHNFVDNKQKYVGKDLNTLLNDVEIPIKSYGYGTSAYDTRNVPTITLDFYTKNEVLNKIDRADKPVNIIIDWVPNLPFSNVYTLWTKNKGAWTEAERTYFGKQIIGNIMTTKYSK